jgi:hypothetical protein
MKTTGMLGVMFLFCLGIVFAEQSPEAKTETFGDAAVTKALRVDATCRIYCDIAGWPAVIGSEIPVQIRGLESQADFSLTVRTFILDTLNAALKTNDANEPAVQLKNIQRGQAFCLIADIDVAGKDLGQMLIDRGYAKKLIVPKTAKTTTLTQPVAASESENQPAPSAAAPAEGFVASKSGKVFHKPTCSHAKRIKENTKVVYKTKEDAVAAGRKPCQTCNP